MASMYGSGGREVNIPLGEQDPGLRMQGLPLPAHTPNNSVIYHRTSSSCITSSTSYGVVSRSNNTYSISHGGGGRPPSRSEFDVTSMGFGGGSGGDDLTSLTWLHSLDMGGMVPHLATPPTPPASPQPHNPLPPTQAAHTPSADRKRKAEAQEKPDTIDYSLDGSMKPPYSYAALIGMAMKHNQNKMTLSAIYKWIKENFAYYKTADPSWQVRHLLFLQHPTWHRQICPQPKPSRKKKS